MRGVATYAPPAKNPSDLRKEDVESVLRKLVVRIAQDSGFSGAQHAALARFVNLVEECGLLLEVTC